jgi:hypothetical protein
VSTIITLGSIIDGSMESNVIQCSPAEVVIKNLGVRPLARTLNISPSTILRWRERNGNIPSRYHKRIIELSKGKITPNDLVFGR